MWSTESVICTESPKNKDRRRRRRMRSEEKKKKKKRDHIINVKKKWQQSWAQFHPPLTPFTVTVLSGLGSVAKIQLFRLKLFETPDKRAWQLCVELRLSSDWQNGPAAGWRSVVGVKWYRRFQLNMAVCSETSQEVVSYWLLGGNTPGFLWRCFKYDEFPL